MNTPSAKLLVLVGEKFACVKIVGRATFTSSVDFKTLIQELTQKGFHYFILDLAECVLMDSTFLGVLTGFGLKLNPTQSQCGDGAIELLNANPRITDLLENLGVLHLFKMTQGAFTPTDGVQAVPHNPCETDKETVTRACLEAHETLMRANPANVPKFKEVTQFLADDLKKLKAG